MRRVGRLALRERAIERRPPPPPWRRRARLVAMPLLAAALVASAAFGLLRLDEATGQVSRARDALVDLASGIGPVVEDVLVEGRVRTSPEALVTVLEPFRARHFLALDSDTVRAAVLRLPWVREAEVSKLLPGTLYVRLDEHAAVALWHDGARSWLVGADGALLAVDDLRPFMALKLLHGDGAPAAAAALLTLLDSQPELARRVTAAARVGQRRWNLYLDGRIEVRLPEAGAEAALARLAALDRDGRLLARAIRSVDLRNPAWASVGLDGEPAAVPAKEGT